MAGYNIDLGMSNAAISAYEEGQKPLSKFHKEDFEKAGIPIPAVFARWLAEKGHWPSFEWHHSGGTWFNEVNFYDIEILSERIESGELDIAKLKKDYEEEKKAVVPEIEVSGSYAVWGGSRRAPKKIGTKDFTGKKIGNWIHLSTGGKKKASGNHITWRVVET